MEKKQSKRCPRCNREMYIRYGGHNCHSPPCDAYCCDYCRIWCEVE